MIADCTIKKYLSMCHHQNGACTESAFKSYCPTDIMCIYNQRISPKTCHC